MTYAGIAKNYAGLYDQAIPWFRRAIEVNRNYPHPHFVLGVALALLGRLDEARSSVRSGARAQPVLHHLQRSHHLEDDERRPDPSGSVGAPSRGRAHGPESPSNNCHPPPNAHSVWDDDKLVATIPRKPSGRCRNPLVRS
jgi:tetratricopeptide (TPR) repeat protein